MNTPATSNSADYSGEQIAYKDSTYELVSKVAFLIGVPQRIFENEHEAPQLDVFNRLSKRQKRPNHPQSLHHPNIHRTQF